MPIYIEDEKYFIFNCLTVADVINPGAGYDEYIFDPDGLKNKIAFKPPKEFGMDVCCTDRLKEAIEGFGLQGVIFSKISDTGKS